MPLPRLRRRAAARDVARASGTGGRADRGRAERDATAGQGGAGREAAPQGRVVPLPGPAWTAHPLDLEPHPGAFPTPPGPDRAVLLREVPGALRHPHGGPPEVVPAGPHAVLYLPGYRDYFFQVQFAQEWRDAGFDFAALEPRRGGRALRPGEVPDDVLDLRHRHPEIAASIAILRAGGARTITLAGHGLGALTAALYARDHPDDVDSLVLTSPWISAPRCYSGPLRPAAAVRAVARLAPRAVWAMAVPVHQRVCHVDHGGDFDFDTTLKPIDPVPLYAGQVGAVVRGIREVAGGLDLAMPVLVATAASTGDRHSRAVRSCETVLDVAHVQQAARRLGRDVTLAVVRGGTHNLALSPRPARDEFLAAVTAWAADHREPPG